ncbi:MAG TPA: threonine/serine exporter [Clostridiales bacterium]|nr:threonine/serine exporter [Clostridiales bacterium]
MFNVQGRNLILAGLNGGIGYFFYSFTVNYGHESFVGMFREDKQLILQTRNGIPCPVLYIQYTYHPILSQNPGTSSASSFLQFANPYEHLY